MLLEPLPSPEEEPLPSPEVEPEEGYPVLEEDPVEPPG